MRPKSRLARRLLESFVVLAVLIGGTLSFFALTHNLHEVTPGKAYRSAQLSGDQFRDIIQKYGIKSVINLRGSNHVDWYDQETNATTQLGVKHYDFALSASQQVTVEEMDRIVTTLASAPKPLLLHCKNGADRSGLVSALYVLTQEGASIEKADEQLTIRCAHFPYLFWHDTVAMDDSFWRYVNARKGSNGVIAKPSTP